MPITPESNPKSFPNVRRVSGGTRPMSMVDAFMYNFLAMGVIFPWTYLWGPSSFPGGSIELAIFLTLLVQIPISLAYSFLATILPSSGGDYLYQKMAFGKWGFVIVMSGFSIWILQWIALSGWLFASLGLAPLLLAAGVFFDAPEATRFAVIIQSPIGVSSISVLLAVGVTFFLTKGLKLYVLVQRYLFFFTLFAIVCVIFIFYNGSIASVSNLNSFVSTTISHLSLSVSPGLQFDFASYIVKDVEQAGFNTAVPFSFLATLGLVPIVWTSLQWATYSVEQNGEITRSDNLKWQIVVTLGSAVAVALLLIAVAYVERNAMSDKFVSAVSAAFWHQKASPEAVLFVKRVLQPFPNVIAMASSGSFLVALVIALGFLANSIQITCNCFIGVTRILGAMSDDGLLPKQLKLNEIDPQLHSPVRAHWIYCLASIPWILAYSFVPNWASYSLGVTFACGYVFAFSALAASKIAINDQFKTYWKQSTIANISPVWFRVSGLLGFSLGGLMVLAYLLVPNLGITGTIPNLIVLFIFTISYLLLIYAKDSNKLVDKQFD
jgi:amino acid transporter